MIPPFVQKDMRVFPGTCNEALRFSSCRLGDGPLGSRTHLPVYLSRPPSTSKEHRLWRGWQYISTPLSTLQHKDVHRLIHMLPQQAIIVATLKLW